MQPTSVSAVKATTSPVAPEERRTLTNKDISVRRLESGNTGPSVTANGQNQQNYQNN